MNKAIERAPLFLACCVAASVLLISPALAQVNGPGPSPSTLFDIVLNLPGDEDVITDELYESVGGVSGQTFQLNVGEGGVVGSIFDANFGSEVNVNEGAVVGSGFNANSGSEVNVSGGNVGGFEANSGSVVNISGGAMGGGFNANDESVVKISGGTVGGGFNAFPGSYVELVGGEFRLNGAVFTGGNISLAAGDVFTGTLADGSSFVFFTYFNQYDYLYGDRINDVTLTVVDLPPADTNPIVLNAPMVSGPAGLRAGQELTIVAGGSLRNNISLVNARLNVEAGILFGAEAYNSLVNISGGRVGGFTAHSGTEVNISSGTVGIGSRAFSGSLVNISGGNVGKFFLATSESVVNISGGTVGQEFVADSGSVVNISGGTVGPFFGAASVVNISGGTVEDGFIAFSGSVVNISGGTTGSFTAHSGSEVNINGGTVGEGFDSHSGSVVNIRGSAFSIDGMPLNNLQPGQPVTITDRDVTLSGVLADGEPFSFDLYSVGSFAKDFFSLDATLTVTLVGPLLLGDCNQDGVVNFQDINSFIAILSSASFLAEADCNQDDVVDFLDIQPFIQTLVNSQASN